MNLYGFAGGDPVNFSDPFGLCKKPNGEDGSEEECRKQLTSAQDAAMGTTAGLEDDGGYALLANGMGANMAKSGSGYSAVSAAEAQGLANRGELVIVAGPGHVATVRPDIDPNKKYPGSGPLIANVGNNNGVMRLSRVFTPGVITQVKYYVPKP